MTQAQFEQHLSQFFLDLRNITSSKGVEYANDADQLANFKRQGARLGIAPEAVLMVFLGKHLDSIDHAVRTGKTLSEPFRGRCLDAALYLILLAALHEETEILRRLREPPTIIREDQGASPATECAPLAAPEVDVEVPDFRRKR